MLKAECCDKGKAILRRYHHEEVWGAIGFGDQRIHFCPWCGHDLSRPACKDISAALLLLLTDWRNASNSLPLVFDVDGVLADDSDPEMPYSHREAYPWVPYVLSKLRDAGHTIVIPTARGMKQFNGDQKRAAEFHKPNLLKWLKEKMIPFDEVLFGKSSGAYYLDDRGFRIRSNDGEADWARFLIQLNQAPPDALAGG